MADRSAPKCRCRMGDRAVGVITFQTSTLVGIPGGRPGTSGVERAIIDSFDREAGRTGRETPGTSRIAARIARDTLHPNHPTATDSSSSAAKLPTGSMLLSG